MSSLYRDYDALAYNPKKLGEERGAINHIKKAKQKAKGLEIAFDPKGHRDFVTGFRKRKQQRRKDAIQQLEAKHKKQRVEQRAERRTKLKQDLGLPDNYGVETSGSESSEDEEEQLQRAEVKVFNQGEVTTTVSVVDVNHSSDEEAGGGQQEEEEGGGAAGVPVGSQHHPNQQQQQRGRRASGAAGKAGVGSSLGKQGQQHLQGKHSRLQHKKGKRLKKGSRAGDSMKAVGSGGERLQDKLSRLKGKSKRAGRKK